MRMGGEAGGQGDVVYVRGNKKKNTGKQTHEGKRASCAAAAATLSLLPGK